MGVDTGAPGLDLAREGEDVTAQEAVGDRRAGVDLLRHQRQRRLLADHGTVDRGRRRARLALDHLPGLVLAQERVRVEGDSLGKPGGVDVDEVAVVDDQLDSGALDRNAVMVAQEADGVHPATVDRAGALRRQAPGSQVAPEQLGMAGEEVAAPGLQCGERRLAGRREERDAGAEGAGARARSRGRASPTTGRPPRRRASGSRRRRAGVRRLDGGHVGHHHVAIAQQRREPPRFMWLDGRGGAAAQRRRQAAGRGQAGPATAVERRMRCERCPSRLQRRWEQTRTLSAGRSVWGMALLKGMTSGAGRPAGSRRGECYQERARR